MAAVPAWIDHAIWWQVYPLGFAGADDVLDPDHPLPTHGLRRLVGWLDHLVELGGNGLLLGPVFTSMSHGYDTLDYQSIDPRLGSNEDFDHLLTEAGRRGIRVVLDGVFNHVGREHPKAQEAIAAGPDSDAGRWLRWSTGDDGRDYPYTFEGHEQLVTLNHDEPAVQQFVGDVMRYWLGRGIDGWRLDAAYAVPAEFWAAVIPGVRAEFGDAWFVGEMIHGEYVDYVERSTVDGITAYELWAATWSSLDKGNFFELDWTLKRHADLIEHFLPLTFISNHDVTRVASQIDDQRHRDHAAVLLCFLPGTPCVYYGDEYGFEGVKEERLGGDDAIRPELPDSPTELTVPADGGRIEGLYARLIGLRRRHSWLVDAKVAPADVANTHITVVARPRTGDQAPLTLQLNIGDEPVQLVDHSTVVEAGSPTDGQVAPHSWVITQE
ncbi:MAG: alpha-amylase family glycosyl hydrolase [Propionibacteriaceae bacterium]